MQGATWNPLQNLFERATAQRFESVPATPTETPVAQGRVAIRTATQINPADLQGRINNAMLLTRPLSDFGRVPGLNPQNGSAEETGRRRDVMEAKGRNRAAIVKKNAKFQINSISAPCGYTFSITGPYHVSVQ